MSVVKSVGECREECRWSVVTLGDGDYTKCTMQLCKEDLNF